MYKPAGHTCGTLPEHMQNCFNDVEPTEYSRVLIENESLAEENMRLKSRNKILVSVNRGLFDRIKDLQSELDTFFDTLKEADEEAVSIVFGEIAANQED